MVVVSLDCFGGGR